jgi:hypothetical protein
MHMMQQWCDAILRDPSFRQQLDPLTGDFTQSGSASYSPCALVLYDYTWRLAGVRQEANELHWNINPECSAAKNAVFSAPLRHGGTVALRYSSDNAELRINGKSIGHLQGTARLVTSLAGKPIHLIGLHSAPVKVSLQLPDHPSQQLLISPNQRIGLTAS